MPPRSPLAVESLSASLFPLQPVGKSNRGRRSNLRLAWLSRLATLFLPVRPPAKPSAIRACPAGGEMRDVFLWPYPTVC